MDRVVAAAPGATWSERLAQAAPDDLPRWLAAIRVVTNGWPTGVVEARLPLSALEPHESTRSYVAGRLCAETALARAGAGRACREVTRSSDGAPQWPSGWCGSISHDATEAVALAAPGHLVDALGVDVEPLLDDDALHAVIDVCLTPAERARLPSTTEHARREVTLRFSAKEAYFKAIYPHARRFVDFVEAEVHDIDATAGAFRVVPVASPANPGSRSSALFAMEGRFAMAGDRMFARVARCRPC